MPGFFQNLLRMLRGRRGTDMRFLCRLLLSERGEASQTALAQEIINTYRAMNAAQRRGFFEMLCNEFSPDEAAILRASSAYQKSPGSESLAALFAAVEPPRQELIRRINTAPHGTETLVALRADVLADPSHAEKFAPLDADLKHLFKSWFNRGFLRLERISWQTSALLLEKLIRYESVHEINGWPDLQRRLAADRRCFAFFHPALPDDPIIFVEVALFDGVPSNLEPLLDVRAPVLPPDKADTAVFYSINNCLQGLRGVPFGSFLIKQVVADLAAEFPNIKNYATLSPLPRFAVALRDNENEGGFTRARLSLLLADFSRELTSAAKRRDPVEAFFHLLEQPVLHRQVLSAPLERLALAYLTRAHQNGKLYDPVATFHLANGARLEQIFAFGNLRPYGIDASFGATASYRYLPAELEENHERFIRKGEIRVSDTLFREHKKMATFWQTPRETPQRAKSR
jgi:malonyl-CoA decarboxylase